MNTIRTHIVSLWRYRIKITSLLIQLSLLFVVKILVHLRFNHEFLTTNKKVRRKTLSSVISAVILNIENLDVIFVS